MEEDKGQDHDLLSTTWVPPQASEHEENGDELMGVENGEDNLNSVDPYIGMEFSTHEEAYNFYNAYARLKGFGVRKGHTAWSRKKDAILSRIFVCDKEGFKSLKDKREDGRNVIRKFDTRCGCNARMVIGLDRSTEKWVVRKLTSKHNGHPLTTPTRVKKHYSHRTLHRAQSTKRLIDTLDNQGLRPSAICKVVDVAHGNEQGSLTQQECQAQLRLKRRNNVGHECVNIVRQFQEKKVSDPQFYFALDLENDGTMRSVFWMDGRSRTSYLQFGDVVCFDVTYRTNNLKLPFAPFTGVNHHRQSTLFGCALLADETEETFIWLFSQWLKCMSGIAPVTIITDQDKAMCGAIHKVFPKTRHRFCSWHLRRNALQNLQSMHNDYGEDVGVKYNKWYWSKSEEKFEKRWEEMRDKYGADKRSWLVNLYNHRDHWAPVYLKDTFTAGMTSTQRSEGINAFFDHFVNVNTELHDFVKQYDNAVRARRAAELEQDFKSTNSVPTLIIEHPIEKQARENYTKNLFTIFQKELKDSYSMLHEKLSKDGASATYAVWNIDSEAESKKIVKHHVVFDTSKEKRIKCSCARFEMEGILCKHSLHILVKKQVLEIPSRYIMQRWTIKARHVGCGVVRNCITNSEDQLSIIKHWALRSRCNKALEDTLTSSTLHDKFSAFLDSFFEEVENSKIEKEHNDNGNESNASNKMPTSSIPISIEEATQITIRDPDKPVATKGRPAHATRIKSGVEIAQEKSIKKQRFCGFCKGKGHYITSCPLAKNKNVARGGRES
ncbi:protein FAR1-RELATED SEQUENCE 5-like [Asparagus officinalis]|uniref:protein FAR1-RELATED SEQUENCE 5-like n=1 Tax=Asparagus officinalis TaxID=4686 RepID=UPI00098E0618|nr:protein FAR1-RELATED SEQUENCE 5-like [Asparagus officinalis]